MCKLTLFLNQLLKRVKVQATSSIFLVFLGALGAVSLSVSAAWTDSLPGDHSVSLWFQEIRGGWLDLVMRIISRAGETVPMLAILAFASVVLIAKSHRTGALALPFMGLTAVIAPILKEIISRPRPSEDTVAVLSNVAGSSFPSGHAFLAITVFGSLYYMAGLFCGSDRHAIFAFRGVLVLVILAIGASRVYLGVHWTSDVVGGYIIGGLALFVAVRAFEKVAGAIRF
jgi:membrane-associated phospholipid phosphatase